MKSAKWIRGIARPKSRFSKNRRNEEEEEPDSSSSSSGDDESSSVASSEAVSVDEEEEEFLNDNNNNEEEDSDDSSSSTASSTSSSSSSSSSDDDDDDSSIGETTITVSSPSSRRRRSPLKVISKLRERTIASLSPRRREQVKEAVDAFGKDLESKGYKLDCESFITKGSSSSSSYGDYEEGENDGDGDDDGRNETLESPETQPSPLKVDEKGNVIQGDKFAFSGADDDVELKAVVDTAVEKEADQEEDEDEEDWDGENQKMIRAAISKRTVRKSSTTPHVVSGFLQHSMSEMTNTPEKLSGHPSIENVYSQTTNTSAKLLPHPWISTQASIRTNTSSKLKGLGGAGSVSRRKPSISRSHNQKSIPPVAIVDTNNSILSTNNKDNNNKNKSGSTKLSRPIGCSDPSQEAVQEAGRDAMALIQGALAEHQEKKIQAKKGSVRGIVRGSVRGAGGSGGREEDAVPSALKYESEVVGDDVNNNNNNDSTCISGAAGVGAAAAGVGAAAAVAGVGVAAAGVGAARAMCQYPIDTTEPPPIAQQVKTRSSSKLKNFLPRRRSAAPPIPALIVTPPNADTITNIFSNDETYLIEGMSVLGKDLRKNVPSKNVQSTDPNVADQPKIIVQDPPILKERVLERDHSVKSLTSQGRNGKKEPKKKSRWFSRLKKTSKQKKITTGYYGARAGVPHVGRFGELKKAGSTRSLAVVDKPVVAVTSTGPASKLSAIMMKRKPSVSEGITAMRIKPSAAQATKFKDRKIAGSGATTNPKTAETKEKTPVLPKEKATKSILKKSAKLAPQKEEQPVRPKDDASAETLAKMKNKKQFALLLQMPHVTPKGVPSSMLDVNATKSLLSDNTSVRYGDDNSLTLIQEMPTRKEKKGSDTSVEMNSVVSYRTLGSMWPGTVATIEPEQIELEYTMKEVLGAKVDIQEETETSAAAIELQDDRRRPEQVAVAKKNLFTRLITPKSTRKQQLGNEPGPESEVQVHIERVVQPTRQSRKSRKMKTVVKEAIVEDVVAHQKKAAIVEDVVANQKKAAIVEDVVANQKNATLVEDVVANQKNTVVATATEPVDVIVTATEPATSNISCIAAMIPSKHGRDDATKQEKEKLGAPTKEEPVNIPEQPKATTPEPKGILVEDEMSAVTMDEHNSSHHASMKKPVLVDTFSDFLHKWMPKKHLQNIEEGSEREEEQGSAKNTRPKAEAPHQQRAISAVKTESMNILSVAHVTSEDSVSRGMNAPWLNPTTLTPLTPLKLSKHPDDNFSRASVAEAVTEASNPPSIRSGPTQDIEKRQGSSPAEIKHNISPRKITREYPIEFNDDNCSFNLAEDRGNLINESALLRVESEHPSDHDDTQVAHLENAARTNESSPASLLGLPQPPEESPVAPIDPLASTLPSLIGMPTGTVLSVGESSYGHTWAELADATKAVEAAISRVEKRAISESANLKQMNSERDISVMTDDQSDGEDVKAALLTLRKVANRLGVKEADLLMAVRSDDLAIRSGRS